MPGPIARPDYDLGAVGIGIVHLGLGAFHRAHRAVYTDAILHRHPRWGICGVSLKTPRVVAALTPQDGLYSVLEKGSEGTAARVIGSVREVLFLGTERDRVIARIADPAINVVSLTVTEKGYCHDPATGRLNVLHPDIAHDLAHPEAPASAIGVLVAGLAARREASSRPLNVVCCDNLPHNGRTVEGIVTAYAQMSDPALAEWIGAHVAFPCTMVDRIVPATTEAEFVIGIGQNPEDEAIIRSVMALAQSLNFEVVAEGVETAEQAAFLSASGCHQLQGFLHGSAVAPAHFRARWSSLPR